MPGLLPDPEDLAVHPLAGHLVERAERLVHQEDRRRERQGPGDRDALLHPARQLERLVLEEVAELDEVEHLLRPGGPPVAVPAEDLERQLHVVLDGPPVEEDGRLEDHPVVAVAAGPLGGLVVDADRARSTARSGRRRSGAGSTCRSPTGRSARRTRPGATSRSIPSRAFVTTPIAAAERLVDAGEVDDGRAGRRSAGAAVDGIGASVIGRRAPRSDVPWSAAAQDDPLDRDDREVEHDPEHPGTTIAAQSFSGPVM